MIAAGSLERQEAIRLLAEPLYEEDELLRDREFVCRKLRISDEEFQALMEAPIRHFSDFANGNRRYSALKSVQRIAEKVLHRSIHIYS